MPTGWSQPQQKPKRGYVPQVRRTMATGGFMRSRLWGMGAGGKCTVMLVRIT